MKRLVIVESPVKRQTMQTYCKDVLVIATSGHFMRLNSRFHNHNEERIKTIKYDEIRYDFIDEKRSFISKIETLIKRHKILKRNIIICTDYDREGEIIAYNLMQHFRIDLRQPQRMICKEITRRSFTASLDNLTCINLNVVKSQQTRAICDQKIGFSLSPLLWKYIGKRLSIGRVQTVVLLLIDLYHQKNRF